MIEPGTPQEVKDWVDLAFRIGRAGGIYMGYMMTVAVADGGGTVECRPNHYPVLNANERKALSFTRDIEPNLDQSVLLPPRLVATRAATRCAVRPGQRSGAAAGDQPHPAQAAEG